MNSNISAFRTSDKDVVENQQSCPSDSDAQWYPEDYDRDIDNLVTNQYTVIYRNSDLDNNNLEGKASAVGNTDGLCNTSGMYIEKQRCISQTGDKLWFCTQNSIKT